MGFRCARLVGGGGFIGMSERVEYYDVRSVTVASGGAEELWLLEFRLGQGTWWRLVLTAPGGASWSGAGEGLWTAFVELRRQTDRVGYRLCCAGARVDANMRSGRWAGSDVVDVLTRRTLLGLRHTEPMLAYAPVSKVGTVEEQRARYARWLATPWWRALLPGDITG